MRLRTPAVVLVVVAVVLAGASWFIGSSGSTSSANPTVARTPVLSARRAPELVLAADRDPALVRTLDEIIADGPPDTCASVQVDGRSIYAHQDSLPVPPASNQKLLTAQLALDLLGADYRYTTTVKSPEPVDDTVAGDLVLVGGGDPVLATKDYVAHFDDPATVSTPMERLADRIVAKGVRHVTGSVVGDESRYDSARDVPSWPDRYLEQNQLGPLSALIVNGSLRSFPEHFSEETRTTSTPADNPPAFAAETFTNLLRDRGVRVDGAPRTGRASAGDKLLAAVTSPPLSGIVRQMLTQSDNQIAELLVKEIGFRKGGAGTTQAGVTVLRDAVNGLGLPTEGVVIKDGSGLDHDDRLTCALVGKLLAEAGADSAVGNGLAVAGRSGTLRDRFVDSPAKGHLVAKTGTLDDVTALSGFARSLHGPTLTFAYIATGELVGPNLLALQDRLGSGLVEYAGPLRLQDLGPQ